MALVKYRYRKIEPDIDLAQLQDEVDASVTIDETHSGQVQNISVDDGDANNLIDLDDAMALQGYTRIGAAVSAYPAEDDELSGWKETLLTIDQLANGASGGILQGKLISVAVQMADGDTFIIDDGTTTETFTFRTVPSLSFDVLIGGSAAATEASLGAQINTDSTLWSASVLANLGAYFSGAPATQLAIYRTVPSLADDRVYGVIAGGQASIQQIDFNSSELQEYSSAAGTQGDLPAADTGIKCFGMGRLRATLRTLETHWLSESGTPYTWDENTETWVSKVSSDGSSEVMWGADSVGTSTTARYLYPGYAEKLAQTVPVQIRASRAGTIRNLRVRHNTPGGSGSDANITYTVRKNNAAQALTVVMLASASDGADTSNSFTVAAGDLIDITLTKAGSTSPAPRDVTATYEFTT